MTVTRRLGTLSRSPVPRLACALLLGLCTVPPVGADAMLALGIGDLEGPGWRASGISLSLAREDSGRLSGRVRIASLELPPPLGRREGVEGACLDLRITTRTASCRDLALAIHLGGPQPLELHGGFDYRRNDGALSGWLEWPAAAPGRLRLAATREGDDWTLRLEAEHLALAGLAPLAAQLADLLPLDWPDLAGQLTLSLVARGRGEALAGAVFTLEAEGLGGSNEAGTRAAEGLALSLRGSAWPADGGLALELRGSAGEGEVYLEPVYARLDDHPLRFTGRGRLAADLIELDRLFIEQRDTVHLDVAATVSRNPASGWGLRQAAVRLVEASLPGTYEVLLKPFLAGTPLGDLQAAGRLQGEVRLGDGGLEALWMRLDDVYLDDREDRLAAFGLSGELGWAPLHEGRDSSRRLALHWSGGFLYGLPIGAAGIELEAPGARWTLPRATRIPVLDGALEIEALEFGEPGTGDEGIRFEARLSPLSMRELSRALDWPPLSGQLAGTLPSLSFADGVLTVAGRLEAEMFGGRIAVDNLRVERLLEPLARLQADVEIRGIELAALTEAFSFGLMTGRLDGYVRDLELIDWRPVAFDARLYTPPGDRSRRRISQRAVDNIASLGGGAGALSGGFLRFFEEFSYDAFALGCRLEQDVCQMSGVEARDRGYVILRGRGLPRIDVMGFAGRVSWSALVGQMEAIMAAEGPEIR